MVITTTTTCGLAGFRCVYAISGIPFCMPGIVFRAIMQFCGYNGAGVANVFTFRVKNMPNSIPVLDANGNGRTRTKAGSQAGRLLSGFNCGSSSVVCNSIFSLLRPSLTCAINSVNISPGSAPRRRAKEHQENAHTHIHTGYCRTLWPCGHVHYDTFRCRFQSEFAI